MWMDLSPINLSTLNWVKWAHSITVLSIYGAKDMGSGSIKLLSKRKGYKFMARMIKSYQFRLKRSNILNLLFTYLFVVLINYLLYFNRSFM